MRKKWRFESGDQGFSYEDDAFRFTSEPAYSRDRREDGMLAMRLGGKDDDTVKDMSGGWTKGFKLDEAQDVTFSFRVKIEQGEDYGRRDFADVRLALDGESVSFDGKVFAERLYGDGTGGRERKIGWQTIEVDLGRLGAGRHEITLGGYSDRKSSKDAYADFFFDDLLLKGKPPEAPKLGAFEAEVLKLTNAFRAKHDRDPVRNDAKLNDAAEDWSREMAAGDFFLHSDKPKQITKHGYDPTGWGENIAAGYPSPKAVVDGWIDSPGHRANLLRADFEHIGIGHYYKSGDGGAAPYVHYWTQIFGVPSDDYL